MIKCVGFEVLTAVVTKSTIYWNITPCSPLNVKGLHGVISQKTELFMIKGDHILYSRAKNLDCNFVKDPIPTSYSALFICKSPNPEPVRHC
jgi:hypothetical protein